MSFGKLCTLVSWLLFILTPQSLHSVALVFSLPWIDCCDQLLPGEAVMLIVAYQFVPSHLEESLQDLFLCKLQTQCLVLPVPQSPSWPSFFGDSCPCSLKLLSKQSKAVSGEKQGTDLWWMMMDADGNQCSHAAVLAVVSFTQRTEVTVEAG